MKKNTFRFFVLLLLFLLSGRVTAGETPGETVKRLITYQEQHEDLTPLLKESVSLLKSPHYDVRFAALRTLVFAGVPCPEAVPELLKILRRPVPEKAQEWLMRIGAGLLIGLMVFATFNDVMRWFK